MRLNQTCNGACTWPGIFTQKSRTFNCCRTRSGLQTLLLSPVGERLRMVSCITCALFLLLRSNSPEVPAAVGLSGIKTLSEEVSSVSSAFGSSLIRHDPTRPPCQHLTSGTQNVWLLARKVSQQSYHCFWHVLFSLVWIITPRLLIL